MASTGYQEAVDHFSKRLLMDPTVAARIEMAKIVSKSDKVPLKFHLKDGFDTSGDHTMFQQIGALLGRDSHCIGSFFTFLQLTTIIYFTSAKWIFK